VALRFLAEDGSARTDLALTISGVAREAPVYNLQTVNAGASWQRSEIVVDVADAASRISLGLQLCGQGWVWLAGEQAEVVTAAVPTSASPRLRPH
jgi:hypothetical protein